jgi:hypothetical protein
LVTQFQFFKKKTLAGLNLCAVPKHVATNSKLRELVC